MYETGPMDPPQAVHGVVGMVVAVLVQWLRIVEQGEVVVAVEVQVVAGSENGRQRAAHHGLVEQAGKFRDAGQEVVVAERAAFVQRVEGVVHAVLERLRQDVVDERFTERRKVDWRREVEERRLPGGEHGGKALSARSREYRLELIGSFVEAGPKRRDQGLVVLASGKFLHFVQHENRRLATCRGALQQVVQVEQQIAGWFPCQCAHVDLRSADHRNRQLELR